MKKLLVVARYNEDVNWLKDVNRDIYDVSIINKGPYLLEQYHNHLWNSANVGRDIHSYYFAIIHMYKYLKDYNCVAFCQGNPFDHQPDWLNILNNHKEGRYLTHPFKESYYGFKHQYFPAGMPLGAVYNKYFYPNKMIYDEIQVQYTNQNIFPAKDILFRSLNFYRDITNYLTNFKNDNTIIHVMERLMLTVFDGKTLDWISHHGEILEQYPCLWGKL